MFEADSMKTSTESSAKRSEQVGAPNNIDLGKESSPNFFVTRNNNGRGFPDCVDGRSTNQNLDIANNNANVSELDGGLQRSGRAFVEAIKKNRACQKLLRDKLAKIQARMEENRKLRERVKIMKDFQTSCRKRTGRALSQKRDARIQLISVPKNKKRSNDSKVSFLTIENMDDNFFMFISIRFLECPLAAYAIDTLYLKFKLLARPPIHSFL